MTKDPLAALQKHFEERYGKLDVTLSRPKKRKRSHADVEPQETAIESEEEEWQGIRSLADTSESTFKPQIISFTETTDMTEEVTTSYKSFMVASFMNTSN
jgi:superfamily II DNA/RNA helicase